MALGSFFSAATTAQNSPELHSRFINSFIQISRVESLCPYLLCLVNIIKERPPTGLPVDITMHRGF